MQSGVAYGGYAQSTRPIHGAMPHPEMACSDTPESSICSLARDVNGQLSEAIDRADRMLGRINGPTPCSDPWKPRNSDCIMESLAASRDAAGALLRRLDELESKIGG